MTGIYTERMLAVESIEELYIRNMDEIKSGLDNRISIINDSIYHVGRYPEDGIYKLDVDISENSRDIISTPTPTQAPTPTPTQAPNQTANDNVDAGAGTSVILYTDIASYINNYPIPSYAYNGKMVVIAEDLRNYGFNVTWDEGSRSLYIEPNYETTVIQGMGTVYSNRDKHGQIFAYAIPSNIKTYLCGDEIPSININGYTMVAIEDLENFDIGTEFTYYDSIRSLKLTENWTKTTEYLPLPLAPGSNYVDVYTVDGDYCGTENNKDGIESVRWSLDSTGTLTISGNGEMVRNWYANKTQIRGWHEYASMITSVVIDEGVANIGAYSFENCTNLQRIYIPGSVVEMHDDVAGNITQPITVYYDGTRDEFTKIGGYDKFPAGTTYSLPRTPVVAQPTENVNNYNVGSYAGVYQKGDICIAVLFSTGSTSEESECYIRQVSYPYRDSNNIATADTIKDFETAQKISGNAYYIDTSDLQCELTFGNETITLSGTDARYSEYYGEYEKVSNMGPNMRQEDIWIK